jgi:hypothetical protein
VHATFVDGPVNEVVFQAFLFSAMQTIQTLTKESCVLVMDNVSFHKTEAVANCTALSMFLVYGSLA